MINLRKILIILFSMFCFTNILYSSNKAIVINAYASSPTEKHEVLKAVDNDPDTRWSSQPTDVEWITFILKEPSVINRIMIHWEAAFGETYQIQISQDERKWYVVYNAVKHKGGKEFLEFKPVLAKYVRIYGIARGTKWGYSIFECNIYTTKDKPSALSELLLPEGIKYKRNDLSPSSFYYHQAKICPDLYPPWLIKKQIYWTMTGAKGNKQETLFSEYGMIDPYKNGFSLMPYLYIKDKLISPLETDAIYQSLEDNYLPIPEVIWEYQDLFFKQKVFTHGDKKNSYTYIIYTLLNKSKRNIRGRLFLTIRPFQITPPWMYGGFSPIRYIEKKNNMVYINNKPRIIASKGYQFGAVAFNDGDIIEHIRDNKILKTDKVNDPKRSASGVLIYPFNIKAGHKKEYSFCVSLNESPCIKKIESINAVKVKLKKNISQWKKDLNRIKINIPDKRVIQLYRSSLAYILINYDESAFIPGPRNYERSWLRDGSIMASAVLRCGHTKIVKEYIEWLISFQRSTGEIPCIIDTDRKIRGEREYDNQGEFLYTAAEYYRFTKDKKFIKEIYPSLIKAVKFINTLRESRIDKKYENTRFYGILPISISHEGFPDPGAHSYYDDWWALKGIKDAIYLSSVINMDKDISWMKDLENDLRKSLLKSIELTRKEEKIHFIPSSAEGHQDACGNSIAIWPTEEDNYLPKGLILDHINDWYKHVFIPERERVIKNNFTPYELRMANALILSGDKEKAQNMLSFFNRVARPEDWNHWAECVSKKYREPVYLGDMPHTWISALYINLVRHMFVYEKDKMLILCAGINEKWLKKSKDLLIADFPTHYGNIFFSINTKNKMLSITVKGNAVPEKGFVFISPYLKRKIKKVKSKSNIKVKLKNNEIKFQKLPVKFNIYY